MYQIVSIELGDRVVGAAVDAIMNDLAGLLPPTNGNFQLITENNFAQAGDGGSNVLTTVVVGHADANGISGCRRWELLAGQLAAAPQPDPAQVYLVACRTAAEGDLFFYGNFAQTVANAYPDARVWAAQTAIGPPDFRGNWVLMGAVPAYRRV